MNQVTHLSASLVVLCLIHQAMAAPPAELAPALEPDQEIQLEDPGFRGHIKIYVPSDYTPDRSWPVLFNYHGMNGRPTTQPVRQMIDGRGAIVVGMSYPSENSHDTFNREALHEERQHLQRVAGIVNRHLNVDEQLIFLGGTSRGGFYTSVLVEAMPQDVAGLYCLASVRNDGDRGRVPPAMRGMSVYMAYGSEDPHGNRGDDAVRVYQQAGLKVTREIWPGLGHTIKRDCEVFDAWIDEHVRQPSLQRGLDQAKQLQRREAGRAYQQMHAIAEDAEGLVAEQAKRAADQIATKAEAELARAEAMRDGGDGHAALRLWMNVHRRYAHSPFAERAREQIDAMREDEAIDPQLAQQIIDALASDLYRQARQAMQQRDAARAVTLYERYLERYPEASEYQRVQASVERLKATPHVEQALLDAEAAAEGEELLAWAQTYVEAGSPAKAKQVLERVLAEYPRTSYAERAEQLLANR
ncbi:MAG: tetratricopeptide repeat protein [Phycisphaeraceae bacterium]